MRIFTSLAPSRGKFGHSLLDSQAEISAHLHCCHPCVRRRLSHSTCTVGLLLCFGVHSGTCRNRAEAAEVLFTHTLCLHGTGVPGAGVVLSQEPPGSLEGGGGGVMPLGLFTLQVMSGCLFG